MNREELITQVDTIRETFGYIEEFKDQIFTIKLDSSLNNSPYFPILIRDVVLLHKAGIRIVLIPGTKLRIDEILKHFKVAFEIVDGIRISTEEAIPFIKMAAFDVSNSLMTQLAENSATAVIGNWVRARSIGVKDGIDYKSTGTIDKIDCESIHKVLDDNMIPIFPNIGWSLSGKPYNISSNELALEVSTQLKAEKLFFITKTPGLSSEGFKMPEGIPLTEEQTISQLSIQKAQELLKLNPEKPSSKEALQLLDMSCKAVAKGVNRVHIVDGRVDGMLLKEIFSNIGLGTMIHRDQYENIRPAVHHDIADILRITAPLIDKGVLIQRSHEDIEASLHEYVVYEVDGTIHGCGARKHYKDKSSEIYSIAVDAAYASRGTGRLIISFLAKDAQRVKEKQAFLLTTQTTDWFENQGFSIGKLENLPESKREKYNHERASKILFLPLETNSTAPILRD